MKYQKLQSNNIQLSKMGLGCASFWANKFFEFNKAKKIVISALENGVNYFDTGHSYAMGEAEKRLGRILQDFKRENINISTKIGSYHTKKGIMLDFDKNFLMKQLDQSLRNLKTNYIDILYLHGPNEDHLKPELWEFCQQIKISGKVRCVGINSFDDKIIEKTIIVDHLDVYMIDYNIANASKIKYFENMAVQKKDIIAAAPLASNFIDKKFHRINSLASIWYLLRAYLVRKKEFLNAKNLHDFFEQIPGYTPQEIAFAFVMMNKNITCAVSGTTKEKHLLENIRNCNINLPKDIILLLQERENEFKNTYINNNNFNDNYCNI